MIRITSTLLRRRRYRVGQVTDAELNAALTLLRTLQNATVLQTRSEAGRQRIEEGVRQRRQEAITVFAPFRLTDDTLVSNQSLHFRALRRSVSWYELEQSGGINTASLWVAIDRPKHGPTTVLGVFNTSESEIRNKYALPQWERDVPADG